MVQLEKHDAAGPPSAGTGPESRPGAPDRHGFSPRGNGAGCIATMRGAFAYGSWRGVSCRLRLRTYVPLG